MAPAVDAPMPGKGGEPLDVVRQLAAVTFAHQTRGAMQIARACVVAEAAPAVQHFVDFSRGERGHVRKAVHEGSEVREHGGGLGLLQHDFRHPYPVGSRLAFPGQLMTPVTGVPGEEPGRDRVGSAATHTPRRGARFREPCRPGSAPR